MSAETNQVAEPKTEQIEYDIFISYESNNFKQVKSIQDKLLDRYKFKIWFENLTENESNNANTHLIQIMKNSTIFLCFVTQKYCQSIKCLKEINCADQTYAIIIFIMVERLDSENMGDVGLIMRKFPKSNVLKCYNSENEWWIEQFDHVKELILENIKNLQTTYRERYVVVRSLGEGAEGFIYKVKDLLERKEKLRYKVLKEFKQIDSRTNSALIEELTNQIDILQSEKHRNIIRYIDFFSIRFHNREYHYLLTEYYSEGSLEELINEKLNRQETIEPEIQKKWSLQMFNGLEFLHNRLHIIHRDIKPGNIFFNDKKNLIIGDFGHSKLDVYFEMSLSRSLRQFGTISYLAPELISPEGRFSSKIDIWSAGCLVYEMATLKKLFPYKPGDDFGIRKNILNFEIENLSRENMQKIAEPLIKKIIKRSLIKDPYRRFTAQEIITLLEDDDDQTQEDETLIDQYCLTRGKLEELKKGFASATGIDLSFKGLRSITAEAFGELDKLIVLDFSNNQIESIEQSSFNGMPNLKVLRLERNRLEFINSETFSKLRNLENLRLDNNSLKSLDSLIFCNLNNLTELGLGNNKLESIHFNTFSKLTCLTDLDLSDNQIEFLDYRMFENLENLTSLKINNNRLEILDFRLFSNLKNLLFLWLKNNRIRELNRDLFSGLKQIQKIRLSGNNIHRNENLEEISVKKGVIVLD